MSSLNRLTSLLARFFAEPTRQGADVEAMSLREWADMPAYHPRKERPTLATPR